ncbi:hypothetical protein OA848_03370 [Rickettsiales bacterium]|nr:hypothetical protein [Rickettsiales bacterium]
MYVEIGGLIKKGLGHGIIEKFSKKKSVITVGVANGRTRDLFDIQEFGDASESEILTIIVEEKSSDKVFDELFKFLELNKKNQGVIYKSERILKGSFIKK